MDPLWASVAEIWWIAPAIVGAGALGWWGLRRERTVNGRRLEIDAAVLDVKAARTAVTRSRAEIAVAHAELVRTQAERSARGASERDVAAARRALQNARQSAKSAAANLRARQAGLRAARATVPSPGSDPAEFPLARLTRTHNAVLSRWMQYETDPAKAIAYPGMSDGSSPLMAVFLREQEQAQWLRPASSTARMAAADFAAYRDAVRRMERAFDVAEQEALGRASGQRPTAAGFGSAHWVDTAQDLLSNAQRVVAWSADAIARVSDGAAAASERFGSRSTPDEATPPAAPPSDPPPARKHRR